MKTSIAVGICAVILLLLGGIVFWVSGHVKPQVTSANSSATSTATTQTGTTNPSAGSLSATLMIGTNSVLGRTVNISLLQDSRCPAGVYCIQAGTVRVSAEVPSINRSATFTLNEPQVFADGYQVTLTQVTPGKFQHTTINPADYRFTFVATKVP